MADMKLYDSLYQDFRRIRHDFANYVQSSQFESEDEDFILRLRMLKKETLKLVDALLERLDKLPLEQAGEEDGFYQYPYLMPQTPKPKMKPKDRVLFALWEEMKLYFVHQLKELPTLIPVLLSLQDRLQRSLPPDEWEAEQHLKECDSIRFHETAQSPLLAAFLHTCKEKAQQNGMVFQYRISVPDCFSERLTDLFYLLGCAKTACFGWAEGRENSQVRLYLASGLGLWHFSMNAVIRDREEDLFADEEDEQAGESRAKTNAQFNHKMDKPAASEEDQRRTEALIAGFTKDRVLLKILKKQKASMEVEREHAGFRIDIMG